MHSRTHHRRPGRSSHTRRLCLEIGQHKRGSLAGRDHHADTGSASSTENCCGLLVMSHGEYRLEPLTQSLWCCGGMSPKTARHFWRRCRGDCPTPPRRLALRSPSLDSLARRIRCPLLRDTTANLGSASENRLSLHRRLRRICATLELRIIAGAAVAGTTAEVEVVDLFALLRMLAEVACPF